MKYFFKHLKHFKQFKQFKHFKQFMKILVTGGAGYVGSTLTPMLLEKGYFVRVLDNLRAGSFGILPCFGKENFEFIKGDIRDLETIGKAVKDMDFIVHLAAIVGFPACRKEPELSREINVLGTENMVKAANKKIPFIFASTGSSYGKMLEKICTETTPLNPLTDYGRQKAEAEEIVKKNGQYAIYRFATGFGFSPRLRLDLLVNDFVWRALKEKNLIVYEKNFMRTFIHVKDMARSFIFAIENFTKLSGEIYNVGDDKMNYSKEDICNIIKKKIDYYLHFADFGKDLDQRDYEVSYEKINKVGFRCKVGLEEGIDELLRVYNIIEIKNPYGNV